MHKRHLSIAGKTAYVFGASGGIGSAIAARLSRAGARVTGFARDAGAIERAFAERGIRGRALRADLGDPESVRGLVGRVARDEGAPDIVVIAAGYDVRAPFENHSAEDVAKSVSVNLVSLMAICGALHPVYLRRGSGSLAYVGGFGDGTIAFPFHSVDAATRSGAATFLSALNRELPHGTEARYLYFGPTAVTTDAERPYLSLWKRMGTPIVSADAVANAVVTAIERGRTRVAMGGLATGIGIAINAISHGLADRVFMNGYRAVLESRFRPERAGASAVAGVNAAAGEE